MSNRKGDLSLSTNAIVVLIIAITILGLALGFTQGVFSTLGDRLRSIGGASVKTPASLDDPITLTNDDISMRKGTSVKQVVSVFNQYGKTYDYTLDLSCVDSTGEGQSELFTFTKPGARSIKVNDHEEFATTISVSKEADGLYSCTITANTGETDEEGDDIMEFKDITITVT